MTMTKDAISIDEWMVAWAPLTHEPWKGKPVPPGSVRVDRFIGHNRPDLKPYYQWADPYPRTVGCCNFRQKWTNDQKELQMMLDFHTLVVRDGIDPQKAHQEFLKVEAYRKRISPDIPGAVPLGPLDAG
jgi:hypothetical protein